MIVQTDGKSKPGFTGPVAHILLSSYLLQKPWLERLPKPDDSKFDGRHIMLIRPLGYTTKVRDGLQWLIIAEAGYVSDGASVPTIFGLSYVLADTPLGEALPGSVIHDVICDMVIDLLEEGKKKEAANLRAFADILYGEMNSSDINPDVSLRQRILLAGGVGLWGAIRYKALACNPNNLPLQSLAQACSR